MVRAILRALKKLARALSPNRFDLHQVCVAQPVDDAETWKKLLTEVQNVFAGSAVKALTLAAWPRALQQGRADDPLAIDEGANCDDSHHSKASPKMWLLHIVVQLCFTMMKQSHWNGKTLAM